MAVWHLFVSKGNYKFTVTIRRVQALFTVRYKPSLASTGHSYCYFILTQDFTCRQSESTKLPGRNHCGAGISPMGAGNCCSGVRFCLTDDDDRRD